MTLGSSRGVTSRRQSWKRLPCYWQGHYGAALIEAHSLTLVWVTSLGWDSLVMHLSAARENWLGRELDRPKEPNDAEARGVKKASHEGICTLKLLSETYLDRVDG